MAPDDRREHTHTSRSGELPSVKALWRSSPSIPREVDGGGGGHLLAGCRDSFPPASGNRVSQSLSSALDDGHTRGSLGLYYRLRNPHREGNKGELPGSGWGDGHSLKCGNLSGSHGCRDPERLKHEQSTGSGALVSFSIGKRRLLFENESFLLQHRSDINASE